MDAERPTSELVGQALALDPEDEERWTVVRTLQDRGTEDVFDAARWLCDSRKPAERELGVDILAQGQAFQKTFGERAVRVLLDLLAQEREPRVLKSICVALGHHQAPDSIVPLARLQGHPDPDVRYAVAVGLDGHDDWGALATLTCLSADESPAVRDWATFGLGTLTSLDSPALRETLVRRLSDEDDGVRLEAIRGLAERHDERALAPLLHAFSTGVLEPIMLEAASALADSRLCVPLAEARSRLPREAIFLQTVLDEALERCRCADDASSGSAISV